MLVEELVTLVNNIQEQKCESNYIEIKSANVDSPKIYDTLSAFSNQTGGGIIIFGINETDNYDICGVYNAAALQKKIDEQCLQMEPVVRPLCTVATIDSKTVVSAEISEIDINSRPCFYKGKGRIQGSYIRSGDADRKMTEYEVYSYEAFRKKTQDELRRLPRVSIKDINTPFLDEYFIQLSIAKPNLAKLSKEKQLQLQGFVADHEPTLAATVLFAEYPQAYCPRLCITAVVVPGTTMGEVGTLGERFIDNATIEGTLSQMLNSALSFVRRNMSVKTVINPETGIRSDITEYPMTAIREILLNSLIHRDYSIHTETAPIRIVMYSDRIEIENPGGLYGRLTIDTLGDMLADTRNPFIASAMEIKKDTENRFSGIPTIKREMRLSNLPDPEFKNDRGVFTVVLYNNITATKVASQNLIEDEILNFCKTAKTRSELANRFCNISKAYLFSEYINKLVSNHNLILSIPDKPKSKNQTYTSVITK